MKIYRVYIIGSVPPPKERIITLHAEGILNWNSKGSEVNTHDPVAHYKDALEEKLNKSTKRRRIKSRKHQ